MAPFAATLGILIWILLSPLILLLFISRQTVNLIAACQTPPLRPIPSFDQIFISSDRLGVYLVGILRLKGPIEIPRFRERFRTLFSQERFFSKEIVFFLGYAFTKEVQVDLSLHIREVSLGKLGQQNFHSFLNELVDNHEVLRKDGVAAWEVLVCNDDENNFVLIKIHHGFVDGYSLINIIDRLTESSSPYLVKPWNKTKSQMFGIGLEAPYKMAQHMLSLVPDLKYNNFQAANEDPQQRSYFYTTMISTDFKKIQEIQARTKCKVNGILTCARATALQRLLPCVSSKYFIENVANAIPEHPAMSGKSILCNHCTQGIIRTDLEEKDLLKRLQQVAKCMEDWEKEEMDQVWCILLTLFNLFPEAIFERLRDCRDIPHYSVLSSLILSQSPYFLQGVEVEGLWYCCSMPPRIQMSGGQMYTVRRGAKMEICCRLTRNILRSQKEMDLFGEVFCNVLDEFWEISKNV